MDRHPGRVYYAIIQRVDGNDLPTLYGVWQTRAELDAALDQLSPEWEDVETGETLLGLTLTKARR